MSDWYSRFERFAVQSTTTCLEMTDARYCSRILEVACGAGTHSEVIAKGFLASNGAMLVSSDFSKEMVSKLKERFEKSDYNDCKGCKHVIDAETDYTDQSTSNRLDLDKIQAEQGQFNKLGIGCMADNMCLPFEDVAFDAYVSNLSLMITQEPERQIVEAYRVLKPGSKACFSIWGR